MNEKGFTLIELMIGIVIAMLCMIMMLMLFKQTTKIGISSSLDSEYDAQIRNALSVTQKLVQNAGYGTGKVSDINESQVNNMPAIFWRTNPDPASSQISGNEMITLNCEGLIQKEEPETFNLIYLKKENCGTSTISVEDFDLNTGQNILSVSYFNETPIFNFKLKSGKCSPYGIDTENSKGILQIQIEAKRLNTDDDGYTIGKNFTNTVCLNNIINQV